MPGEYSKFPEAIRETFPLIVREVAELRTDWELFHRLFMDDRKLTEAMAEKLGGVLGKFQTMLQDELLLSIARLADKSTYQQNLSLRTLNKAIPGGSEFKRKVSSSLAQIEAAAENVVKHRHKRIAHLDLAASLDATRLPLVTLQQIRQLIESIEDFLNLFYWEFENTTMFFNMLHALDITGPAEQCVFEAKTYDLLEDAERIDYGTWRRVMHGQPINGNQPPTS